MTWSWLWHSRCRQIRRGALETSDSNARGKETGSIYRQIQMLKYIISLLWIPRRHRTPRQISAVAGRRTASDHGRLFTGCDPLFRHGISTNTGSMPGVSHKGEDAGGNSGNLYVVCGGIFCRYAGIGDPQDHFPGSGEEGYPAQPAGEICPQRCNGEEAIGLAGNITGRTAWDRAVTTAWNPKAHYYTMNETLRASFYEGQWQPEHCEPIPFSSVRRIIL